MEVDLGEDHQARTMICTGDAKVNDPKVGRKISGQKAVYRVSQRQVDITGEPVAMSDKDGNLVNGKRVLYYVDDGRAVVQGKEGEENPAPAMTSPARPPKPDAKKPAPAKPAKPPAAGTRGRER
jgi:lipopolysaccharide export system protein LptA